MVKYVVNSDDITYSGSVAYIDAKIINSAQITGSNLLVESLQISSSLDVSAGSLTNYITINVNGSDYKLPLYAV
jgi:hypothetical protein